MELEPLDNSITAQISESPLVIRMFGPMEALVHGENIAAPRNRKAMWLLALLALRGERETERKWLATTLWPDSSDELALYNLRRYLTVLRDLLGPESKRILSPSPRSLAFDVTCGFVDVLEFDRAFMRGDSESMNSAISLYTGPFLEGCLEEWAI